jgi:hypothetical protein
VLGCRKNRAHLLTFALCSITVIASDKAPTFFGIWVLDTAKSDFEARNAPDVLRVDQEREHIAVIEVYRNPRRKVLLKWDYVLEGREGFNPTRVSVRSGQRREAWTLSPGGTQLTIQRSIEGRDGSVRLIFRRSTGMVDAR